ncbi:hypothetical protein Cgig2_029128 [Carnegiea gigantea]|uniref:PP4R3 EVH1-like domain-containing protein n=1 Tax=Carnegiea gigantea TaxID=171969 RepID=A0A9Q1KK18_9CARY|nr:hypothetical protein Cgig2_029128 [Carnegiea gigantea]
MENRRQKEAEMKYTGQVHGISVTKLVKRLVAINMNALFSRSKFIVGVRMESGKIGELVMLLLIIWRFDILFVILRCYGSSTLSMLFTIQGNVEMQKSDDLALFVYEQDSNETILMHRISPDDIYRKQEDTIISWRDPLYSTELAVSFREVAGCSYIWYLNLGALLGFISFFLLMLKFLCYAGIISVMCEGIQTLVPLMNPHSYVTKRLIVFSPFIWHIRFLPEILFSSDDTFHGVSSELRELPTVALSTLPLILKVIFKISAPEEVLGVFRSLLWVDRQLLSAPVRFVATFRSPATFPITDDFSACHAKGRADYPHLKPPNIAKLGPIVVVLVVVGWMIQRGIDDD